MKKSQIILGASAFVLAIAGAFASKANHFSTLTPAAVKPAAGGCQSVGSIKFVTKIQGSHLTAHTSLGSTLFTAACTKTLFTNPNN